MKTCSRSEAHIKKIKKIQFFYPIRFAERHIKYIVNLLQGSSHSFVKVVAINIFTL